jgi:hypothetical protein
VTATTYHSYQTTDPSVGITVGIEWVFVAPPGTHTYTLVANAFATLGTLNPSPARLVATTHPFGSTGTPGTTEIDPAQPSGGDRTRP